MKIGIFTEYFYPTLGGITENIYHFARELLKHGHDFRIITGFRGEPTEISAEVKERIRFIGRNIPVFFNGSCGRLTVGLNLTKKVKELLREEKFDIIHTHSPLFPTLPIIANYQAGTPVVGTFHTCTDNTLYYKLYRGRAMLALKRMSGRIAVSECCARENMSFFDADFDVIPNGVDVAWWSGAKKIAKFDDGRPNILFLGRPDRRNGLDTLIHAFSLVHENYPNTRLVIVGDGLLRFHFKKIVPDEIASSVVFEGSANGTRPDYLAMADIFCFTPSIASFGVTILEGMSAKKAIVASDIEAFRALVKNGVSALLVPPGDVKALAMAIEKFLANPGLRKKMGDAAFSGVRYYDWSGIAKMQIDYYRKILAS